MGSVPEAILKNRHTGKSSEPNQDEVPSSAIVEEYLGYPNNNSRSRQGESFLLNAWYSLPLRWRNWVIRVRSGICLISGFSLLIYIGPSGLIFLSYLVLCSSYSEVITLGIEKCSVPSMKPFSWTVFFIVQQFLIGNAVLTSTPLSSLAKYNDAISFSFYLAALSYFVLTMEPSNYMNRYSMFAWIHTALLFMSIPVHLAVLSLQHGMVWYIFVMTVITINDIAAYMVGFVVGKTPLIQLSPKKTLEGFIGGFLITVTLGTILSYYLMLPYLTCPVINLQVQQPCTTNELYLLQSITIYGLKYAYYPFVVHGFFISVFASLIGPFGGFFASGFKRACGKKNFGSFIPGHGGVLDRCDCMYLMAAFMYFYLTVLF